MELQLRPDRYVGSTVMPYVEVSASAATRHYFGSRVNTEWDEEVVFKNGRWEYPPTADR
jgi:hypothetical protein